jgi:2-dehydropantoate 2-reductase
LVDKPEVLIAGTGALACIYAWRLSAVASVVMLGTWREAVEAIERDGVRVETAGGQVVAKVRACLDPGAVGQPSWALVLVKSYQTTRVARQLGYCLAGDGLALTLQNGLGNREALEVLGEGRVAQGVTTVGATVLGPGHVRLSADGRVHLARQAGVEPLAELLDRAGFALTWSGDLESLVWGKLVASASINPLTALLQIPNGELLQRPAAAALLDAAAREVAAVAKARGTRLPFEDAGAYAAEVARSSAGNSSSMLQDVRRGSETEIDAINGAVAGEAVRLGVPAPVNRTLWQLVRALRPESGGTDA